MIGTEDDDRVLQNASRLQSIEDLADLRVDHRNISVVVRALPPHLLLRWVRKVHDGVVVLRQVLLTQGPQGRRLRVEIPPDRLRQWPVGIFCQIVRGGIVWRMRPGQADLQEEGLLAGIALKPQAGQISHKDISMQVFVQLPDKGAKPVFIVLAAAVGDAARLFDAARPQRLVSLVEIDGDIRMRPILVLHHMPLVEAECSLDGIGVHLAHIDAAVACPV